MKLSSARIIVPALSLVLAGAVLVACKNAARRDGVGAAALVESGSAQESSSAPAENEYQIHSRGEDHSVDAGRTRGFLRMTSMRRRFSICNLPPACDSAVAFVPFT